MYKVIFRDCYGYTVSARFFNFPDAASYWQHWADFPVYVGGTLTDMDTHETLWEF